ncbi:hypothetical protein D918_08506 [Trichuris suis]|nr:hypothetical protein D918_08506 [Trichuris suis]
MCSDVQDILNELGKLDDARAKSFFDSDSYYDAADNFSGSGHKKLDNDHYLKYTKKELKGIETRASLFKRFAHEKCTEKFYGLVDEAVKTAPEYEKELLKEILSTKAHCEKTFPIQLTALEANLLGIKALPVPRRNDWALDNVDGVLRDQVLDFLDFVDCLCKQPANEAAKFICMWSALLFRLIAKSAGTVEKEMKNFSDVFVLVTRTACTIKNYSLPLKVIEVLLFANRFKDVRLVASIAGLEILSQPDNSRDMNLLKRSRKYCYVDTLKYCGMKAVRLAYEAASVLKITVDELFDLVLKMIPVEHAMRWTRSIRHSCHLLKLLLRDFSDFDACDSWMYARVFDDMFFSRLKNKLHNAFVYFCCYIIDPQKRVGVGVWAMKHQPIVQAFEEEARRVALAIRQKCNVD